MSQLSFSLTDSFDEASGVFVGHDEQGHRLPVNLSMALTPEETQNGEFLQVVVELQLIFGKSNSPHWNRKVPAFKEILQNSLHLLANTRTQEIIRARLKMVEAFADFKQLIEDLIDVFSR